MGGSAKQSVKTVICMSSVSIVSVHCWVLDTSYHPDAGRSNLFYRRFAISLTSSDAIAANWGRSTNA